MKSLKTSPFVSLQRWQDLNVISSLLKSFFRKLPEPLFTDGVTMIHLFSVLCSIMSVMDSDRLSIFSPCTDMFGRGCTSIFTVF